MSREVIAGELMCLIDAYGQRSADLHGDREVNEGTQEEVDDECGYVYDAVIEDLRRLLGMVEGGRQ